MLISRKYSTGQFCNQVGNYKGEIPFDEHPQNLEFLNSAYPYLNQFLENIAGTGICFGISLWKLETTPPFSASLNSEEVHKLITSDTLLNYQLWNSNGHKGLIQERESPAREELITILANGLYEMQVSGENRVEVSQKKCKLLAGEFLETLESEAGKIVRFFNIRYGWADWFALDSNYDFGFLLAAEKTLWLMTFSESD